MKAFKEARCKEGQDRARGVPAAATTTDFTAPAQRIIDALKDKPGPQGHRRSSGPAARQPVGKIADLDRKRYGIEIATGGNILPAMAAYKQFPGMEGAIYYYFGIPKNPVNDWLVAKHYKRVQVAAGLLHRRRLRARRWRWSTALKKTNGDTNTNKLITTMEGMSFETPKGTMTFRKEDHQAMQTMYHFTIKVDPAFAWGVPELVREIKACEMNVPIRNKR